MDIIKPRIMKGTRDFLPEDMYLRERVINIIKEKFTLYGFRPLQTPAMEYYDVLTGKYGQEGDTLIFDMAYKGGKEVALKYDLTVPMCRVIAQYKDKIVMPFKRFQIQPVWRAEKPQKGRLREFYQCDADIVGIKDVSADAEIIVLISDIMEALGFSDFVTHINHRKLLSGIMAHIGMEGKDSVVAMRILDKIDKIGAEKVKEEFIESGYKEGTINDLFGLTEAGKDFIGDLERIEAAVANNQDAKKGIGDLKDIFQLLSDIGIATEKVSFSPRLARGLAYYTGPVYETFVRSPKIGSLAGGGRYDDLIGLFSGIDVPATGFALGLERIIESLKENMTLEGVGEEIEVIVVPFGPDETGVAMKIARSLRERGVNTDIYMGDDRLKKKLKYADRLGVPKVVIVAPDEISRGVVKIKDMKSGDEKEVEIKGAAEAIFSSVRPT